MSKKNRGTGAPSMLDGLRHKAENAAAKIKGGFAKPTEFDEPEEQNTSSRTAALNPAQRKQGYAQQEPPLPYPEPQFTRHNYNDGFADFDDGLESGNAAMQAEFDAMQSDFDEIDEFDMPVAPDPYAAEEYEQMPPQPAMQERINARYAPDGLYESHLDEIGYVPPSSAVPKSHIRYRRRNRRPWLKWQKATLTGVGIAAFFTFAIILTFYGIMTSRLWNTSESVHNTVYLEVDEKRALAQEETDVAENESEFTVPTIDITSDENVKVIMLVASDRGFGKGTSSECDAIMLLVLDHRYKQIKLISILPELYVRIPGYYSNKLGRAFYYDTAKGDYSLSILRETMRENFHVAIDNYVVVDFAALQTLVNRLGGVTMELKPEEADYMRADPKYGLFPRYTYGGVYNMSGAETLNFVRMEKIGDTIFERSQRQRRVMYELVGKIKDLSFIEKSELTYAMLPMLATDMTKGDAWYYFRHAKDISNYTIDQLRLPIEGSFRYGEANVLGNTFEVLVTNYAFTSEALRDYIYENDTTYQGDAFAEDVVIPMIAPLPEMLEEMEEQQ